MKNIFTKFFYALFVLLFANFFLQIKVYSQSSIQWQKCLGGTEDDWAESIQQTSDGGYIVAGYTNSNDGDVSGNHSQYINDYWVVKLTSTGNIKWQKCLGGNDNDQAKCVRQTSDGGYIVAGFTSSNNGDVTGNHGARDYWVVKLDTSGVIQWQKCLGGEDWDEACSIEQANDGGYIVAGWSGSNDAYVTGNHGDADYWIVKLYSNGSIQWQKSFGGTKGDVAYSIQKTSDLGYIVTGISSSTDGDVSGFHAGTFYDYWVVKLSDASNIQWQKCFGGINNEQARSVRQTTNGYIVAGYSYSNDGDVTGNHNGNGGDLGYSDIWLVYLNSSGVKQWQKCLGGSANDMAYSIQQTTDGGYIIAASTESTDGDVTGNLNGGTHYWIIKLDVSGNIQGQKILGGTSIERASSIQQTSDGGYIVAGYTSSNDGDVSGNHGGFDFWVVKLSSGLGTDEDLFSNTVSVYPNPVKDLLQIETLQKADIEISNIEGQIIKRFTINNNHAIFDLSDLSAGVFIIKAIIDRGIVTKKFIKQ